MREQSRRLLDTVRQGELEVLDEELADVRALDIVVLLKLDDLEDVNGPEAGAVAGSHVLVQGLDGISAAQLTVLLVHVVGTGAGVVADPDAKVLDLGGALLVDLVDRNDLTVGLFDTTELGQKVPETGLGDNLVRSKNAHAIQLGLGGSLRREVAADNLILVDATHLVGVGDSTRVGV